MLGAYNGVILQADVSESADMSRAHRVAIYTCRFASRFLGADKSARQIAATDAGKTDVNLLNFSLSNMQICDVLVTVIVVIA